MNAAMTYSRALPEAMGYTVTMDDSAGYGVTRMLLVDYVTPTYEVGSGNDVKPQKRTRVWNPRDNSEQCLEVLAWLSTVCDVDFTCDTKDGVRVTNVDIHTINPYDGGYESQSRIGRSLTTPAGLRAAIVEAAERVAGEQK